MRTDTIRRLSLLRARNRGGTSDFALLGLEDAMVRRGMSTVDNDQEWVRFLGKVLKNLSLQGSLLHRPGMAYFLPMMGPQTFRAFPNGLAAELVPYVFDCWPSAYDEWRHFLRRYRIKTAFFSARQSADWVREHVAGVDAIWMPEAIDPAPYQNDVPIDQRTIDVLELGRRSATFHDRITEHCRQRGYCHRYQLAPTSLVFDDRAAFLQGMTQTKIMICFPCSQTNPERSGDVETMTLRYLEGMASGCVVLGHAPQELLDLFGYNPVVEADMDRPGLQIDTILGAIDSYQPLIERNRSRLAAVGTWDRRVDAMLSLLDDKGYNA